MPEKSQKTDLKSRITSFGKELRETLKNIPREAAFSLGLKERPVDETLSKAKESLDFIERKVADFERKQQDNPEKVLSLSNQGEILRGLNHARSRLLKANSRENSGKKASDEAVLAQFNGLVAQYDSLVSRFNATEKEKSWMGGDTPNQKTLPIGAAAAAEKKGQSNVNGPGPS